MSGQGRCGEAGSIRSGRIPSRTHQTERGERRPRAWVANGGFVDQEGDVTLFFTLRHFRVRQNPNADEEVGD